MNCRQTDRLWPLWAASDLKGRKRTAFDAHLAACPDCRARAEALDEASDLARGLLQQSDPALSATERARLLSGLGEQRRHPGRWTWALAATCAAALLVLLVWPASPTHLGTNASDAGLAGQPGTAAAAAEKIALVDAANQANRYEMRLSTSDPKVKIVWVFDRNLNI